jgi:hypothetical protein
LIKNPAKRLGLQEIYVHFGTFDFATYCIVGPWQSVAPYIAWKLDYPSFEWDGSESRGHHFYKAGYVPVIWIPRRPRTPREYGTLAHEVLHVVRDLGEWIGINFTNETDEVFCHATAHAMTTILEELRK